MSRKPTVQPELRAKLNRARNAQRELDALRERVEYWRAKAERCTASYGPGAPGGGGAADRRAELAARIVDAQREIEARIGDIAQAEREALELIALLDSERARTLLTLYYVDGLRWREVAERMHYNLRYVERLHLRALEALAAAAGAAGAADKRGR